MLYSCKIKKQVMGQLKKEYIEQVRRGDTEVRWEEIPEFTNDVKPTDISVLDDISKLPCVDGKKIFVDGGTITDEQREYLDSHDITVVPSSKLQRYRKMQEFVKQQNKKVISSKAMKAAEKKSDNGKILVDYEDVPEFSDDVRADDMKLLKNIESIPEIDGQKTFTDEGKLTITQKKFLNKNGVKIQNSSRYQRLVDFQKAVLEKQMKKYDAQSTLPDVKSYHRDEKDRVMDETVEMLKERAKGGDIAVRYEDVPVFSDDEKSTDGMATGKRLMDVKFVWSCQAEEVPKSTMYNVWDTIHKFESGIVTMEESSRVKRKRKLQQKMDIFVDEMNRDKVTATDLVKEFNKKIYAQDRTRYKKALNANQGKQADKQM